MKKTVYYNGKVYTGTLPLTEAFVVEGERFVFVGSSRDARKLGRQGDDFVDLGGRFVCGGFIDSHMHLLSFGDQLRAAQLGTRTDSLEDMLDCLREFETGHPHTGRGWLVGRGWNQDYFTDVRRMPNRYDLDRVSTEVPVCAVRACGHCLVVNSLALKLLGVPADSVQPEGGQIGMEDGVPDGRFFDKAMDRVYDAMPVPSKEEVKEMLHAACLALNHYGVTSCHSDDYSVFRKLPWQVIHEAYRELWESGELTVRVYEQCNFTNLQELREFMEAGNVTGAGTDFFRIGPLKMLGDGSLGSQTAYLSKPYADAPETCGIPVFDRKTLEEMIGCAHEHGMQVAVHAIGDGCLDWVLQAYEKALKEHPRPDHRHGIVHCQITRPDQLEKIAKLGLHVYAQSIFLDYDIHIVETRVGKERAASSYGWKTLMKNGVSVSNGSDCPVELPDVMAGIQCAVTRKTLRDHLGPYRPEEAFTVQEALDSYTIRGAEGSFEEQKKGRIQPGMLADFVILGRNPFETEPEKLREIPVVATYLGGTQLLGDTQLHPLD